MVKETDARVDVNGLSASAVHGQRDVNVGLIGLSGDGGGADRGGRSGSHDGYVSRGSWGRRRKEKRSKVRQAFLSISVGSTKMVASTWTLTHRTEKMIVRVQAQLAFCAELSLRVGLHSEIFQMWCARDVMDRSRTSRNTNRICCIDRPTSFCSQPPPPSKRCSQQPIHINLHRMTSTRPREGRGVRNTAGGEHDRLKRAVLQPVQCW